jgi:hypothetical protein
MPKNGTLDKGQDVHLGLPQTIGEFDEVSVVDTLAAPVPEMAASNVALAPAES